MLRERLTTEADAADPHLTRFQQIVAERADPSDLAETSLENVKDYAAALWAFGAQRRAGETKVRVRVERGEDALHRHSVLEIVTDDKPFLVASTLAQIAEFDLGTRWMCHPILVVERGEGGGRVRLVAGPGDADQLAAALPGTVRESLIQIAFDRVCDGPTAAAIERGILKVMADVAVAVGDWQVMRERIHQSADELKLAAAAVSPDLKDEFDEAVSFLEWLRDNHFTFLGCRDYQRTDTGGRSDLVADEATGLGLLRDPDARVLRRQGEASSVSPAIEAFLKSSSPVIVTKSNERSSVHRRVYMDYVGVKRFDGSGRVIGERRFVGLFAASAYNRVPREIPLLRRKVDLVLERTNYPRDSHNYNALANILETFPRDELFQVTAEELQETATGIMRLFERPRTRVFLRHDSFDRFVSALVFVPRERYTSEIRERIGAILKDAFDGRVSAFYPLLGDQPLVRVHYIIGRNLGPCPKVEVAAIEARILSEIRSWRDGLREALIKSLGEDMGRAMVSRYGNAFTGAYRDAFSAEEAIADIARMETLKSYPAVAIRVYRTGRDTPSCLHVKLYQAGEAISLSRSLPVFENLGLSVETEFTYPVSPSKGHGRDAKAETIFIHDFHLVHPRGEALEHIMIRPLIEAAFPAIWSGEAEDDGFNRLVVEAGLGWRDITVLRGVAKFLIQTGKALSQPYMESTLAGNPTVTRLFYQLFRTRHDPALPGAPAERQGDAKSVERDILKALEAVSSLDEDRILRSFLNVLSAMLRTNFYQLAEDGSHRATFAFKLDSKAIEGLPLPKPHVEIFVYSPRVEGVHLRFGPVARGGLRWSDRREDFRTEVLGLVKAQYVKNAVIVPVGAKGGFVPKRLPADGPREAIQAEGIACYEIFVSALFELTDNLAMDRSDARPVRPDRTVAYDGPDPYLVVAADKGTASFSDIANRLSLERGFWLGDAFASGGSNGYDHKAMAITARGAWEAVKRHFRELGLDVQSEPFTVVGVGDMSGDVFGNGMLLSRTIRLIAAFDHRDIFIDPNPDPQASWTERKRLFDLPRSSWQDYSADLISKGGGVFSRKLKTVPLSEEARAALGISQSALSPAELIRHILRAKVDLLWFGGIGTYVKAASERHLEVADPANDALRIDGEEIRARVVAEGANLGCTQKGRIACARAGGRINTDAIDNSAGVDCSDHEVNIKILLDAAGARGRLAAPERTALLKEMTESVADLVLADNYDQTLALTLAETTSAEDLDAHGRFIRVLEREGRINRLVEALPSEEVIADLKQAGLGLSRPEIAVLLAHAKIKIFDEIIASPVPDDPALRRDMKAYFPAVLAERFPEELASHRLRREIIATQLANEIVNVGGLTFVNRMRELTGADTSLIARAYVVVRDVFAITDLRAAINALDGSAPARTQTLMQIGLRAFLRRQAIWLIRRGERAVFSLEDAVNRYRPCVAHLEGRLLEVITPLGRDTYEKTQADLIAAGVPAALAGRYAGLASLWSATDIAELSAHAGITIDDASAAHFALGAGLNLEGLVAAALRLTSKDHWERLAIRRIVEDLLQQQAELTRLALKATAGKTGAGAIAAWLAGNDSQVRRVATAFEELEAAGSLTAARLALAVGHLRDLVVHATSLADAA